MQKDAVVAKEVIEPYEKYNGMSSSFPPPSFFSHDIEWPFRFFKCNKRFYSIFSFFP